MSVENCVAVPLFLLPPSTGCHNRNLLFFFGRKRKHNQGYSTAGLHKQTNTGDTDQGCRGERYSSNLCVSPVVLTVTGSQESLCNNASKCLTPEVDRSELMLQEKEEENQ